MSFSTNNKRSAENDTIELEEYPVLDAGVYHARLESIDTIDLQFGPTLKFTWKVQSGESAGLTFDGLANRKLTARSKLSDWTKAHLQIASFPSGFVLALKNLIGKEVSVVLGVEPRKDGNGDTNTIQAISPYKPASKKPKAPEPPQQQAQEFGEAFEDEIPDPGDPVRGKKVV